MPQNEKIMEISKLRMKVRRIAEAAMAQAQGLDVPAVLQTPEIQNTQKRKISP